ncbi:MAG: hypothetical protein GEV06_19810 [Luteitalea sp.]|nr:hypothetical protein [Luteitalea sp.]
MPNLVGMPIVLGQDAFTSSATQLHPLGTRGFTKDGRRFRYAQAGATTVAGSLYQSAAPLANHLANTPPAVDSGAKSFVYTPGATGGAANLYAEGYMQVDTTPGNGYTYQVSGHGAITASTAFTLTLVDPIQVALTTSSRVGLIANPYKNVIVAATTVTAPAVGVSPCIIASGEYGWLQTYGPASVLVNGTPGVGVGVVSSATTAGAVDVAAVAAEINVRILGRMAQVGVSGKNNFCFLTLD